MLRRAESMPHACLEAILATTTLEHGTQHALPFPTRFYFSCPRCYGEIKLPLLDPVPKLSVRAWHCGDISQVEDTGVVSTLQ